MPDKNHKALKPGWRQVKFGDVVRLSKVRSQDPLTDGFDRYVGLEHLEPGDLRIRSWGHVSDGVTFTSVFQPTQVLFGKRRAYQRKVAVADFAGVCSGDIYVLETKDEQVLLPKLLPFICQTDAFFDRAVDTSAGSLSPRTSWTKLAEFEFQLAPLNFQRKLVDLLASSSRVLLEMRDLVNEHSRLQKAALYQISNHVSYDVKTVLLEDLCHRNTVGIATSTTHAYAENGVPLIRNQNIRFGRIDSNDLLYITPEFDRKNANKRLKKGDVITVRTGYPGTSAVVTDEWVDCQTFTTLISTPKQDQIFPAYLCWYINSPAGMRFIESRQGGAAQKNMNATQLRKMPVLLPSLSKQEEICRSLDGISMARGIIDKRIKEITNRHQLLINELLMREADV